MPKNNQHHPANTIQKNILRSLRLCEGLRMPKSNQHPPANAMQKEVEVEVEAEVGGRNLIGTSLFKASDKETRRRGDKGSADCGYWIADCGFLI